MKFPGSDGKIISVKANQKTARQCYTESLKISSSCKQSKKDPPTVAHITHVEIANLDPRSDYHDKRPSPIDELDDLQIGKLPGQCTKISRQLSPELRQQLEAEILKNADLFAWSSADMPGINADFIYHRLATHKEAKPVETIITETQKLLNAGFIREVRYTTWLANVVLVKKSSGKWCMCVDYTNLNRACPKDSYPLPSIDRLVDGASGHALLSFLNAYSRYNRPGRMTSIWSYLKEGTVPEDKDEARKVRMRSTKFVIIGDELFKRGIAIPLLKCLTPPQAAPVIEEFHWGISGMHSGARSMATRVLQAGYYWPTLKLDCQDYVQKCKECQQFGNTHRQPPEALHHMMSAWPFSQWGIDILGPFPPAKGQLKFFLVVIDNFTKWIETCPLAKITTENVQRFTWRSIICRFGIPPTLVTDNGRQFIA
uniref:Gypsy retrotransposon integrase-like protein 1 n=1 Tax=Cajanus cajan TaxID=3821 RepID=A0A151RCF1_CAJCA|nr:Gypsy retrotransposon integrase-like protein 1 [Cajanus cajan]